MLILSERVELFCSFRFYLFIYSRLLINRSLLESMIGSQRTYQTKVFSPSGLINIRMILLIIMCLRLSALNFLLAMNVKILSVNV